MQHDTVSSSKAELRQKMSSLGGALCMQATSIEKQYIRPNGSPRCLAYMRPRQISVWGVHEPVLGGGDLLQEAPGVHRVGKVPIHKNNLAQAGLVSGEIRNQ